MRFSRAEWAALGLTAVILIAYGGFYLRDVSGEGYTVSGAHPRQAVVSATPRVFVPDELIDVNTATADQLTLLPGVGQSQARAIVDYREQAGGFSSPEELLDVPGIGPAVYEKLVPYITLSQP